MRLLPKSATQMLPALSTVIYPGSGFLLVANQMSPSNATSSPFGPVIVASSWTPPTMMKLPSRSTATRIAKVNVLSPEDGMPHPYIWMIV